jgi:hypothetical protein
VIARLVITALLAQPLPDAGAPDAGAVGIDQLYVACPTDVPLTEAVDGGFFVPEARARRQVCMLTACESYAEPKLLEAASGPPAPSTVFLLVGTGVGVLVAGIVIGLFVPRPAPGK